jgi:hypothetical protein
MHVMNCAVPQDFAPSLLPATLAGLPQTLRETSVRTIVRLLAFEAALAARAARPAPDSDDHAGDDDDGDAQVRVSRSQGRSILTALGLAAGLVLVWVSVHVA